jgi:hypothetical protein
MSYEPDNQGAEGYDTPRRTAADRTNLPGIFLIVTGVVSLLFAGFLFLQGVQYAMMSVEQVERNMEHMKQVLEQYFPGAAAAMDEQKMSAEQMKQQNTVSSFVTGGVVLIAALVTLIGGIRMRSLSSYGLAVTGAILACIPCVSCLGCCGAGQAFGIWALVVLFDPEVKAAFR